MHNVNMLKTELKQKSTSSLTHSWGILLVKYNFKQKLHTFTETNARWYSVPNENSISENNK